MVSLSLIYYDESNGPSSDAAELCGFHTLDPKADALKYITDDLLYFLTSNNMKRGFQHVTMHGKIHEYKNNKLKKLIL